MINPVVKAILFDLGGVLINLNYQKTIQSFEQLGVKDFQSLYSQAEQSSMFDDYETGKVSSFHFINRLLDQLPRGTNPNQVVKAWNDMILDFPKNRLEILENLSQHYPIFLLSNTNDLHMEKVRRELSKTTDNPLESYFSEIFLSQEIGLRKPNSEVFHFVSQRMGYSPNEILFIDDSIQHIESAKKLGFHTIHLTEPLENHPSFS